MDAGAKAGSTVKVHLRDDLVVDGSTIAPAGTTARLVFGGAASSAAPRQALISLDQFETKPGLLPVGPVGSTLPGIDVGTLIPAKTLATVDHLGNRFSIEVPFPFPLSNDVPISQYTPTPAKTASPRGFNGPTRASAAPSAAPAPPSPGQTVAAAVPAQVAAASPTAAPAPNPAEAAFLAKIMRELPKRYPTPAAAMKAGYFRYSNEDLTGAISYANRGTSWTATDPLVPSQLWYDVHGRLIGADYSLLQSSVSEGDTAAVLGIDPKRFGKIGAHVHYVTCDGAPVKCTYGKAVGAKKYAAANGGDYFHPTAAGLVKAGAVKRAASVRAVFLYPAIYDVAVWVVPNPLGQFADKNPAVTPSPKAGRGEDDPM